MSSEPVLKLENINFSRENTEILSNISLEVSAGENLAIIGPNGAGKSMLVSHITGYQWPSSGKITVLGETYGKVNLFEVRKHMGIISTSRIPEFPMNMRVRDIVATGFFGTIVLLMGRDVSADQWQKVDQELEFVGMARHANKPFRQLSTGEKMRTLIARAIIKEPKLLIFDEPCSGLDMKARALVVKVMDQMADRKNSPTIIIVTHHLEELPTHLDKVLLINDGKEIAFGQPDEVITDENFSVAFDCKVKIMKNNSRYQSCVVNL